MARAGMASLPRPSCHASAPCPPQIGSLVSRYNILISHYFAGDCELGRGTRIRKISFSGPVPSVRCAPEPFGTQWINLLVCNDFSAICQIVELEFLSPVQDGLANPKSSLFQWPSPPLRFTGRPRATRICAIILLTGTPERETASEFTSPTELARFV